MWIFCVLVCEPSLISKLWEHWRKERARGKSLVWRNEEEEDISRFIHANTSMLVYTALHRHAYSLRIKCPNSSFCCMCVYIRRTRFYRTSISQMCTRIVAAWDSQAWNSRVVHTLYATANALVYHGTSATVSRYEPRAKDWCGREKIESMYESFPSLTRGLVRNRHALHWRRRSEVDKVHEPASLTLTSLSENEKHGNATYDGTGLFYSLSWTIEFFFHSILTFEFYFSC